ncbi:MAG: family 16 glycoside hydrolase [Ktedonobacteraceae bacterium]
MDTSNERAENHSLIPKKMSVIILACVALLILSLLGSSVFWFFQTGDSAPGHANKNILLTTPSSSPTTEITPPASALFYDTFVNNQHGWSLSGAGGDLRILTSTQLILANSNPDSILIENVPTSTQLDDYVISVDFTLNLGDTHDSTGLYVRGDSHLDHDYRIDINGNKTVDVAKEWLDDTQTPQNTILATPQATNLLNPPGSHNTLTVFMIDQTITVLINNVALTTVTDPTYISGQIALFVHHGSSSSGAIYAFNKVEIDRLASPFATPVPTFELTPTIGQP